MIDRKGVTFIEYDTKLLWLIEQCVVYDEDETIKWQDQSYRSSLHRKTKLNCYDRSNGVRFIMKTKQDNMINHIGTVYAKIETKLS